jgi:hypothetical protein
MLNARERETLREIQHQFSVEKPGVARPFPAMRGRSPSDRDRPMYATAALVTTALFVLMLVGPNVLTEKEIRARMTSSPRRSWATPGSLPELTDLDHLPWTHAQPLSALDELSRYDVLRLPKTLPDNSSAISRPPQRHTSPLAA